MSCSVEDNVLFGSPRDDALIHEVCRACCIEEELRLRSSASVGESNGDKLSGGEKARIGLARVAYTCLSRAKTERGVVALLDDPFASLDARVGRFIFRELVQRLFVEANVICVIVSHDSVLSHSANKVIRLIPASGKSGRSRVECQVNNRSSGIEVLNNKGEVADTGIGTTRTHEKSSEITGERGCLLNKVDYAARYESSI